MLFLQAGYLFYHNLQCQSTVVFFVCMHVRSMCYQPLNSKIISQVKLWYVTLQSGLWAAADDVKHCLMLAILTVLLLVTRPHFL